ncbi:MAG: DNA methyltransferase, partial [Candidatus Kariarchaeaceae archaeon]|jgi:site-specific DNA-methyltransferase (adenine-specific)
MASNKGDLILEPFLGSGSVVISALKYDRQFIGFELSNEIYKIAKRRIHSQKEEVEDRKNNLDYWIDEKKQ